MKTRLFSLLLAAAVLLGVLSGCGRTQQQDLLAETPAPDSTETGAPLSTEVPSAPASGPDADAEPELRTITDMAGREVLLPAEINTIATFGACGVLNAFVELMGAGGKLCNNMSPSFTRSDKWKMQYEFAPQIADAPVLETADREVLIEEVLNLSPDLCLTMTKATAEYLEENGLAVVFLSWSEVDDVKAAVELMGEILGAEEIAADYIRYFDATVARAEQLTAGIAEDQRAKVLYGSVVQRTQPHRIAEWWIAKAGAVSVTDDGHEGESYEYTTEKLLEWNPDVILMTADEAEELRSDAQLAGITAIMNDRMYMIPTVAHVWGNRTVEQPLTILWTINKCYPDLLTNEALAEEIHYFYEHFFLYDMSDAQLDAIIG